ncbi:hypothetical protein [Hallella seregens]|uniref:Lipoprotein n=1 Tax=Hallella seregens ATCC 51272 TaxID=1336250 RepID=A0ABV5ZML5_9BACT|nr:hypothetical protein [Hallella seregens]
MKKIFLIAVMSIATLSMQSCLQYDEPGDEFEMGQLKPASPDSSSKAKTAIPQRIQQR